MTWFGIDRGPDRRPPEVRAASDKIIIGHGSCMAVFLCTECGQSSGITIEHLPECSVGRILNKWTVDWMGTEKEP